MGLEFYGKFATKIATNFQYKVWKFCGSLPQNCIKLPITIGSFLEVCGHFLEVFWKFVGSFLAVLVCMSQICRNIASPPKLPKNFQKNSYKLTKNFHKTSKKLPKPSGILGQVWGKIPQNFQNSFGSLWSVWGKFATNFHNSSGSLWQVWGKFATNFQIDAGIVWHFWGTLSWKSKPQSGSPGNVWKVFMTTSKPKWMWHILQSYSQPSQ